MQKDIPTQQMQIRHPSERMTPKERAHEMWAVHPLDLDRLGYKTREDFYEAHIDAAVWDAVDRALHWTEGYY